MYQGEISFTLLQKWLHLLGVLFSTEAPWMGIHHPEIEAGSWVKGTERRFSLDGAEEHSDMALQHEYTLQNGTRSQLLGKFPVLPPRCFN